MISITLWLPSKPCLSKFWATCTFSGIMYITEEGKFSVAIIIESNPPSSSILHLFFTSTNDLLIHNFITYIDIFFYIYIFTFISILFFSPVLVLVCAIFSDFCIFYYLYIPMKSSYFCAFFSFYLKKFFWYISVSFSVFLIFDACTNVLTLIICVVHGPCKYPVAHSDFPWLVVGSIHLAFFA